MDRLRRYVCAFTDAIGAESTTEKCEKGVPVPEPGDPPAKGAGGLVDVTLPWSGLASDPRLDASPSHAFAKTAADEFRVSRMSLPPGDAHSIFSESAPNPRSAEVSLEGRTGCPRRLFSHPHMIVRR